ncbi:MAG: DUF4199 domain-containing protein [Nonlabens sp.]|uniref:DUF4199 domain-containing protein n=1 Tax=Nonlabens sp. TaxID=1888209 RepID=UPI003EFB1585
MDQIVKKNSFIVGLIGALFNLALVIYVWKTEAYADVTSGIIMLLLPIPFGIAAQWWSKKSLNGYMSLKQGVLAFFLCMLVIFLIDFIVNYLIYVHVDPSAQAAAEKATESFAQKNENALASQDVFKKPVYSLGSYFTGFLSKLLIYTIPGILSALIFRKDIPQNS